MKTETIDVMGQPKRCAWVRFVRFHPSTGHNAGEEVPFPIAEAKAHVKRGVAVWTDIEPVKTEPVINEAVAAPQKPKAKAVAPAKNQPKGKK